MEHFPDWKHPAASMPTGSESIGQRTDVCNKHGEFIASGKRYIGRINVWSKCPQCEAERLDAEQTAKREEAARRQREHLDACMGQASIPRRFIGRTLESFDAPTPAMQHAKNVATQYAQDFERHITDGTGLLFGGEPGTGKSHLAIAILQAIMPRHVGLYATCAGVIRAVRSTWGGKSERTEAEVMQMLAEVPLLVLDEVGVQMGTDNEQHIIFGVLDSRYRDMRPTIILTNQDAKGLKQYLGERSYDRLRETSKWVPFKWSSYRGQA